MDISIITINYNTSEETINCVKSVIEHTSKVLNYEIIVVDNASEYSDYERLKDGLPNQENIQLVRSRKNLGFGGGNNFGVNYTSGKYYVFLNSDCLFIEDTLEPLYTFMERNNQAGVCGSKVIFEDKTSRKPFFYFKPLLSQIIGLTLFRKFKKLPSCTGNYTQPIKVDYVMGSLMFFRASAFNTFGGFDSNIFLYFEEYDLCYRMNQNKIDTYYVPTTTYMHKGAISADKMDDYLYKVYKENIISYFYVFRKCYGSFNYTILRIVYFLRYFVKAPKSNLDYRMFLVVFKQCSLRDSLKQTQKTQPK